MRIAFVETTPDREYEPEITALSHAHCLQFRATESTGWADDKGLRPVQAEAVLLSDDDQFCCDICHGTVPDHVPVMESANAIATAQNHLATGQALRYVDHFHMGDHGPLCYCWDCLAQVRLGSSRLNW
jgi:hypothetical protein